MTLAERKAARQAANNTTTQTISTVDSKEFLKPFIGFKTFPKGGLKLGYHTFGLESQYEALALIKGNGDAIQLYGYDKVESKLTNKIVGENEIIELSQLEKIATINYDNSRKYPCFVVELLDVENDF